MNENIDLVEILKNAPKGTKLYSSVCGECWLNSIYNNIIRCIIEGNYGSMIFDSKGRYSDFKGECVLFPSKQNRDWSTFEAPWKQKNFEPYQKVLVPNIIDNIYYWSANFYSYYNKKYKVHVLIDGQTVYNDKHIIPYEGNEDKLGEQIGE